jgi:hypothetical protein
MRCFAGRPADAQRGCREHLACWVRSDLQKLNESIDGCLSPVGAAAQQGSCARSLRCIDKDVVFVETMRGQRRRRSQGRQASGL